MFLVTSNVLILIPAKQKRPLSVTSHLSYVNPQNTVAVVKFAV